MTIIFNALNFHPEIVGNGKYTSETVFWLSQKFERVIVITTNPYYPKWVCDSNKYKKESFKNITIFRCPVYIPKRINGFTKVFHYLSFLIFSLPINLYALKYTPKIIITICPTIFSIPNSLLIKFLNKIIYKKKLFTWLHYQDLEIEAAFNLNIIRGKYLKKIILFFERYIINQLDLISTISDEMFNQVATFHQFRRKFNWLFQAMANIWLVTVTVLAAIFTALVSTKDSPFSDDNKSLASAWFVFSIFVVISQIVSQVTTKGEKAMKFVKYLAREFGAMDKTKRPLNQRVLDSERSIYEITYKFYNKLRELDGHNVLTNGFEDLTLSDLVSKIKMFYSIDGEIYYDQIEEGPGGIQQEGSLQTQGAFASAHSGVDSNESRISLIMQDTLL